ncbi:MAG: DUF3267 domain-containing protein [Pirellulales bacterium]|nr:DUF3267 domain-containing protein [Pirellulales bacterium]
MIIRNRFPRVDSERHQYLLDNQWTLVKGPKSIALTILLSIPLMFLNAFIAFWIIRTFDSITFEEFGIGSDSVDIPFNLVYLLGFVLILIISHELMHLVFMPNFIKSKKTYIGLTYFGGYVYSEEIVTKIRFIIMIIAPFFIISIILPIILSFFGLLTTFIKLIVLANAASSSVDILCLILILMYVPSGASLANNGSKGYWKKL